MISIADISYSVRTLAAARNRSLLTMLGIIIGVMSVMTVSSVGASAQDLVVRQVTSLGSNLVGVLPGGSQENGPPPIAFGIITTSLIPDDAKALGALPHVLAYTPYVRSTESASYRENAVATPIVGVSEQLPLVEDITVADGRFFSGSEVADFGRVAVLGSKPADSLFPNQDPIGKLIRVKGIAFQVIGVIKKRGTVFFQDQDDQIFIPYTSAQRLIKGVSYIDFMRMKVDDAANISIVHDSVQRLLRVRHRISDPSKDDFSVRSTEQAASILGNITGALKLFLLAVTAISLVVGGVNIMNVMFVAVRERTREIGLRKAVGATEQRVFTQFLLESVIISLVGAALGIVLGVIVTALAAGLVILFGYQWQFIISYTAMFVALGISAGIGIIFGATPAISAARLAPIVALRYE